MKNVHIYVTPGWITCPSALMFELECCSTCLYKINHRCPTVCKGWVKYLFPGGFLPWENVHSHSRVKKNAPQKTKGIRKR